MDFFKIFWTEIQWNRWFSKMASHQKPVSKSRLSWKTRSNTCVLIKTEWSIVCCDIVSSDKTQAVSSSFYLLLPSVSLSRAGIKEVLMGRNLNFSKNIVVMVKSTNEMQVSIESMEGFSRESQRYCSSCVLQNGVSLQVPHATNRWRSSACEQYIFWPQMQFKWNCQNYTSFCKSAQFILFFWYVVNLSGKSCCKI